MFTSDALVYFPCISASSITNQISYMIFLNKKYLAVWDNDTEGRSRIEKAAELFGEIESKKFVILNAIGHNKNTRLEEYYDQNEINHFNLNHLRVENIAFYKTIISLFYEKDRPNLIETYFPNTRKNFSEMEATLIIKMEEQVISSLLNGEKSRESITSDKQA